MLQICNALHVRQEDKEEPEKDMAVKKDTDDNPEDIEKGGAVQTDGMDEVLPKVPLEMVSPQTFQESSTTLILPCRTRQCHHC